MPIYNRTGKVIEFQDGSTVDLKALLSNPHNYQLETLSISEITTDKNYETSEDQDKGPSIVMSENSLKQSLRIYGMVQPLTVGRVMNEDGSQAYVLLDGYKRYDVLKEDETKRINCLVIDLSSALLDTVIRFLSNQKTKSSVDEYLRIYDQIIQQTPSIKKNFVEPALGLKMNDLALLRKARASDNIQVARVYQRYINETTDINTLARVVKRDEEGQTRDEVYHKSEDGPQDNSQPLATDTGQPKDREMEEIRPPRSGQPAKELSTGPSAAAEPKDNGYKDGAMGFGVDKDGAKAIEGIGGNKVSIHPDLPDKSQEEKYKEKIAQLEEEKKKAESNQPNQQNVNDRQILSRELRWKVLERDENRCQVCGIGGKKSPSVASTFELHHMIDVQYGGPDTVDNLITLCPLCHRLITTYGQQKKGILHGLKPYNPSDHELDQNPQFWTIVILGAIEKAAYKQALAQLKANKRTLYIRVMKHTLTIGQALAEYKGTLKFDFSPYEIVTFGKLRLMQTKGQYGFDLLSERLADKYESYGDSIIEDKNDEIHKTIDNIVDYHK